MHDRSKTSPWIRAVLLPAALGALEPCAGALAHLAGKDSAMPRFPHHLYWMWIGMLAAWAGWRVVRRSSSRALGSMLAGAATYFAAIVPAFITASLVNRVEGFHPATWIMGWVLFSALSVAAMLFGWLGGVAATLATRRRPA
jgi:hypothetical protein